MRLAWLIALFSLGAAFACVDGTDFTPPCQGCLPSADAGADAGVLDAGGDAGLDAGEDAGVDAGVDAGTRDAGGALTVNEWNLEFFGKADAGPTDDVAQEQNAAQVMGDADADLWALEEVCDEASFQQLLSDLKAQHPFEDYGYVLANDPNLGHAYSGYGGAWGQKTALLYRKSVASVLDAQLLYRTDLDPNWSSTFASRDPLEVHLRLNLGNGTRDVYVIVVHLKASADPGSYAQRQQAAADLLAYLSEPARSSAPVIVVGDWNDDLDQSITSDGAGGYEPSPFQNLVDDSVHFLFPTKSFSDDGVSTTAFFPTPIDHHLITDELFGNLVPGSAAVINTYPLRYSTSDHYPTSARYQFP
jgi:endonuclease/exonuclease/phosphatase family metal-dependent hydrolase